MNNNVIIEKKENPEMFQRLHLHLNKNGETQRVAFQGINTPVFCKNHAGETLVFKPLNQESGKRKDIIYEICASHIMKYFNIPTITYREVDIDDSGHKQRGVICDFIQAKNLEEDPSLIYGIKNVNEAVRGMIFDGWLGNFDRILTNSNLWINNEGKVVFGDYGCSFRRGLKAFGLPKANILFMYLYGKKEIIEDTINEITSLSDEDIISIIDESLKFTTFEPEIREHMIDVLKYNRDELKTENPFSNFYEEKDLIIELTEKDTEDIAMALLDRYGYKKEKTPADMALSKLWFYKDISLKPVIHILSQNLNNIVNNYINSENKKIEITIKKAHILYILRNTSVMIALKELLRKDITDVTARLFSSLLLCSLSNTLMDRVICLL